jgi:hypothetical protein
MKTRTRPPFRMLIALGLAGVVALGTIGSALAVWCWSDPVVGVSAPGMEEADITIDVGVDGAHKSAVSLVEIVVTVPSNVNARVKFIDNVLPEEVTIVHSNETWRAGQTVKVNTNVRVVSAKTFDVGYTVKHTKNDGNINQDLKTGQSNVWVAQEVGLFVKK